VTAHPNARLEAFCDGVFAIALTLLIIEVRTPAAAGLHTSRDLWLALGRMSPSVLAFLLSFGVILIVWVNHHAALKLVEKSSPPFIYANGFLLLTVVLMPFPTALLGENLLTDHASPAVVLYSANSALQAVAWWLLSLSALKPVPLTRSEPCIARMRTIGREGLFAFVFYTTAAIAAVWLPLTITVVIIVTWTVWLIYGIRLKE
jgi:uncharacterized membrane protein